MTDVFGEEFDVSINGTGDTTDQAYEDFYEVTTEQNLAIEMYDELCQQKGIKCKYISRTFKNVDDIFGEDLYSAFYDKDAFPVTLFPLDFTNYNPEAIFGKTQYTSSATPRFHIVKKRFTLEAQKWNLELVNPKPGDLILVEITDDIFELSFNEPSAQYYSSGIAYVWELMCERFRYAGEEFETNDERLDTIKDVDSFGINPDINAVITGDNVRIEVVEDPVDPIVDPDEGDIFDGC